MAKKTQKRQKKNKKKKNDNRIGGRGGELQVRLEQFLRIIGDMYRRARFGHNPRGVVAYMVDIKHEERIKKIKK